MNRIAVNRLKKGYSQADFAELMGVSRTTVCNWENGKVSLPIMEKISDKLGISLVELYGADTFVVTPANDYEVRFLLNILSCYAENEGLAKMIREAAIC